MLTYLEATSHVHSITHGLCATLLVAQACSLGAQEPRKSPHETVKATIDGANISIEYGRPYMKGRKVEGGLDPYDDDLARRCR